VTAGQSRSLVTASTGFNTGLRLSDPADGARITVSPVGTRVSTTLNVGEGPAEANAGFRFQYWTEIRAANWPIGRHVRPRSVRVVLTKS
jgi:hypothetical protein